MNAALAVVLAVTLAGQAVAIAGSWGAGYWVVGVAVGVVAGSLALFRRRHRVWTAAAGLGVATAGIVIARVAELPAEPGPAVALALAVLVGSVIRHVPAAGAGAIAAAGLAVVAGSWVATLPTSAAVPAVVTLNVTGWLAAVAAGLLLRLLDARRQAATEAVRCDERLELARELHDVVAHHVTGIVLQAQAARLVSGSQPEQLHHTLAGIEQAGTDALAAMRRVVGLLRDAADAAPGRTGPEHLSELVGRFDGHGPAVHLRAPDTDAQWPPEVASTVYRVVQEALTNVARHAAQAGSVTVSVTQDGQTVAIEVVDDAPPTPARSQLRGGYGLIGMRERVEALGGTLHAGPRPGNGWSVVAALPIPVQDAR